MNPKYRNAIIYALCFIAGFAVSVIFCEDAAKWMQL